MVRKTALVKLSGDLIDRSDVLAWIRKLAKNHFVVVVNGGGVQINAEFEKKGFGRQYGPLGREAKSFEERQLARDILEMNRRDMQDQFAREGIPAVVLIPVLDIGSVLCHVNGDVFILTAYHGFTKLFVLTFDERVEQKRTQFEKLWKAFGGEGMSPKIDIVGFPETPPPVRKKRKRRVKPREEKHHNFYMPPR